MNRGLNLHVEKNALVRVYRNLHQKCYSVQRKVKGPHGRRWLVVRHEHGQVHLKHATFEVNERGRQKVLAERRKNVHAFVVGLYGGESFYAMEDRALDYKGFKRISYNPYKGGHFVDHDGRPVVSAEDVWLTPRGVFAMGVRYARTEEGEAVVGGVQQDAPSAGVLPHAS
jgi:hypothetical protein